MTIRGITFILNGTYPGNDQKFIYISSTPTILVEECYFLEIRIPQLHSIQFFPTSQMVIRSSTFKSTNAVNPLVDPADLQLGSPSNMIIEDSLFISVRIAFNTHYNVSIEKSIFFACDVKAGPAQWLVTSSVTVLGSTFEVTTIDYS